MTVQQEGNSAMKRNGRHNDSGLAFPMAMVGIGAALVITIANADRVHEAQAAVRRDLKPVVTVTAKPEIEAEEIIVVDTTAPAVVAPEGCTDFAESIPETEPEIITDAEEWESLGRFKLTFFCPCRKCNGKWAGKATASGEPLTPGTTIAVDPRVIPLGTVVRIGEREFIAQDTGGAIKGNRIDICLESHSECLEAGVQYADVSIRR